MKTLLAILFFLIGGYCTAQVRDNFEDGDYSSNPVWYGDTAKFKVLSGQLKSQSGIVNDKYFISTSSSRILNTEWQFFIRLDFNTSSANYVDVFLSSDSLRLTGANSGYFVRIGGTDDEISLFAKQGNMSTKLIDGRNGLTNHSTNVFKVMITCDSAGLFTLWRDSTGKGEQYKTEGSAVHKGIYTPGYFGLSVRQSTASFFYRHYLDDLYVGKILKDTTSPRVAQVQAISSDTFQVLFSEKMRSSSLQTQNFEINYSIGNPYQCRFLSKDSNLVELAFLTNITSNKEFELSIRNCRDRSGNKMKDTVIPVKWLQTFPPGKFEVLINEIMADPDPSVLLPQAEYIELFNSSPKFIQLENCSLGDPTTVARLPDTVLEPDSFLILCREGDEPLFKPYGKVLGIHGLPSLNNSLDQLSLRNPDGVIVHPVAYSTSQYGDALKENGGWSLEMIDPGNPCGSDNFRASTDKSGGTPGKINSIRGSNPDTRSPWIKKFQVKNPGFIELVFDESLDSAGSVETSNYLLDNETVKSIENQFDKVEIELVKEMKEGSTYKLSVKNIRDCSQNVSKDTVIQIGMPLQVQRGDILINEVLFNPPSGGADFVEVYNGSGKLLSFKNLLLFNFDSDGNPADPVMIDSSGLLFYPGELKVFTTDPEWLSNYYKKSSVVNFLKLPSLPSMPDKTGHLGITTNSGEVIDAIDFSEGMHFQLLTDFEGVSLERISPGVASEETSNFTSAAASWGYATPGLPNSHNVSSGNGEDWLHIEPAMFSPDEDGNNDLVSISIRTSRLDCQATIILFDPDGQMVSHLVNNIPVGASQTWFWDGLGDDKKKAGIGIYIVYAELFGLDGKRQVRKKTVTLGGR